MPRRRCQAQMIMTTRGGIVTLWAFSHDEAWMSTSFPSLHDDLEFQVRLDCVADSLVWRLRHRARVESLLGDLVLGRLLFSHPRWARRRAHSADVATASDAAGRSDIARIDR